MTSHGIARHADRDPPHLRLDRRYGRARRARRADAVLGPPHDGRAAPARDDGRRPRRALRPRGLAHAASRSSTRSSTASCGARSRSSASATASPCCDLLGPPLEALAAAAGHEADLAPGRPIGARRRLLPARRGHGVRRQARRRPQRRGARGGRHRARRRLADGQDAALDVPRLPRLQDRERPARARHRAAGQLFPIDRAQIVGLTIDAERLAQIRGRRLRRLPARTRATAMPSSTASTRSSTRRPRSSGGSAVRSSTSRTSRSRRPRSA